MALNRDARTWSPRIGEVYAMRFDGEDSEQSGLRPGLVFQNNTGNAHSPNIIALPMTSNIKKAWMPTHVLIRASSDGLARDSLVICENPQRMSKSKVGKYITTLSDEEMKRVAEASLLATSAISYLDLQTLIEVWRKSADLNRSASAA